MSNDIDIAIDNMSGVQFVDLVHDHLHPGAEKKNYGVVAQNSEKSKHLETAIYKIHGMSIDFVNLRSETYT